MAAAPRTHSLMSMLGSRRSHRGRSRQPEAQAHGPATPVVQTRGLKKVFGTGETRVEALRGIDFEVEYGEFVAIMGPSGSGKSTLLHILGALDSPSGGTVAVAGLGYEGLNDAELTRLRHDRIGFVFQFFNLLPSLTAEENVTLPALIGGRRNEVIRTRAQELLDRVGLAARGEHLPGELSGGEQQRVSIARALLLSPELILADEPTGNLDSRSGASVLDLLREVNRADGQTVVMVTHDPGAAARADRVVFLRDGCVAGEIEGGSAQHVFEFLKKLEKDEQLRPADPAIAPRSAG